VFLNIYSHRLLATSFDIIMGIYYAIFENLSITTIILLYFFEINKSPTKSRLIISHSW